MDAGQAVAEVLRREGVEVVFCFPSNPLIDSVAEVGIRPIVGREERTVINMADGVHPGAQRPSDRRVHGSEGTRRRARLWRCRPGVCRFRPDLALACRRTKSAARAPDDLRRGRGLSPDCEVGGAFRDCRVGP